MKIILIADENTELTVIVRVKSSKNKKLPLELENPYPVEWDTHQPDTPKHHCEVEIQLNKDDSLPF
jgi:hypothetical protein